MNRIALTVSLVAIAATSMPSPITFRVGAGNRTQQIAQVESVTDFETFTGRTDKVSGSIVFDPVTKTGSGSISVDVASISTGIDARDDHMRSPNWLDAARFPSITFTTSSVRSLGGDRYAVAGKMTLHGVSKTLNTTVTLKHMKASAATEKAGFKGDVLQAKASFKVKLSDFGVKIPNIAAGKVAETVSISIVLYGQSGA